MSKAKYSFCIHKDFTNRLDYILIPTYLPIKICVSSFPFGISCPAESNRRRFFATYYSTLDPPGLPRFISQLGCCPSAFLSLKCILERFSESKQCPLVVYDSPFPLTALSDSHNLMEENFHAEFVITIACQVCFPLSFSTNPQL